MTAAQGNGDAAPLQALAWVVGRLADDVRAAAARAGTAAGVEWSSLAADGFRRSLTEHAEDVHRCSVAVDEAAAALAAHAVAVARPGLLHLAARVLG